MKKMRFHIFASLIFIGGLCACATLGSLKPGDGTQILVENKEFNEIWSAAIRTIRSRSELKIVESDKAKGIIKAEAAMSSYSWGELIGVFIAQADKPSTYRVDVVARKRATGQISGTDWEPDIVAGIQAELGI